jgi:hypothetical protein
MTMLEELISLVQYSKRKDVKLTITVESGNIQVGVDKMPRRKGDRPTYLTSVHCGGATRNVEELATAVILELASNGIEAATRPNREPR